MKQNFQESTPNPLVFPPLPIFISTAKKGKRPEDPRKGFESLHKREGTKTETVLDQGLKRK